MKANAGFVIGNSLLLLMICLISVTFSNANGIRGTPAPPNASPCILPGCYYDLDFNGTNYAVKYVAAGPIGNTNPDAIVLNEIRLDVATKSVLVNVTVAGGEPPDAYTSYFSLWLSRSLINANNSTSNNAPFVAYDNDKPLEYYIGPTYFSPGRIEERTDVAEIGDDPKDVRVLSIGLQPGNHNIKIIGTTIAPEFAFPFASMIIAAISVALVLVAFRFAQISRFPPQQEISRIPTRTVSSRWY